MINEVTVTRALNGFTITVYEPKENKDKIYVATSVKDSYSFGSVSLMKVLDELFNPKEELPEVI